MKIYDPSGSHDKLIGQIYDPRGSLDKALGLDLWSMISDTDPWDQISYPLSGIRAQVCAWAHPWVRLCSWDACIDDGSEPANWQPEAYPRGGGLLGPCPPWGPKYFFSEFLFDKMDPFRQIVGQILGVFRFWREVTLGPVQIWAPCPIFLFFIFLGLKGPFEKIVGHIR